MNTSSELSGPTDDHERFLRLFTQHQTSLMAFLLVMLRDRYAAEEVMQESALVIWREFETFDASRPFLPWAKAIAFNQVRAYRRSESSRKRVFAVETLEVLAEAEAKQATELGALTQALQHCLGKLRPEDRDLVELYYGWTGTARELSDQIDRSVNAIYKAIKRIRKLLFHCVEQQLTAERP